MPRFTALVCSYFIVLAGCSGGPRTVHLPSVSARDAASFAMEHYDADHNGAIDGREIASCPPLAVTLSCYDADGNGQLSAKEIEDQINHLYGPGAGLTSADCTVTLSGRPLHGATVRFRPVEMLGPSVKPAEGVTNASGVAHVALDDKELPDDLHGVRLAHPGLYHVEITHPKVALPARYNTATELGFEVDPLKERTGTWARFDLKLK